MAYSYPYGYWSEPASHAVRRSLAWLHKNDDTRATKIARLDRYFQQPCPPPEDPGYAVYDTPATFNNLAYMTQMMNQPSMFSEASPLSPQAPSFTPTPSKRPKSERTEQNMPGNTGGEPAAQFRDYRPSNFDGPSNAAFREYGARRSNSPARIPSPQGRAKSRVPCPTTAYLRQTSQPMRTNKLPKPLLLVLDLNGTLLHRPKRSQPKVFEERPFTQSFLKYALRNHVVMIWSSATPANVSAMCEKLFPENRDAVVAQWSRDHLDLTTEEYYAKVQVYKRLEKVWADPRVQASYPEPNIECDSFGEGKWNQTNTVLIDDTMEKAKGHPFNLIELPEFVGKGVEDDTVLAVLVDYLQVIRYQYDVSAYMRKHPFKYETLKAAYSAPDYNSTEEVEISHIDQHSNSAVANKDAVTEAPWDTPFKGGGRTVHSGWAPSPIKHRELESTTFSVNDNDEGKMTPFSSYNLASLYTSTYESPANAIPAAVAKEVEAHLTIARQMGQVSLKPGATQDDLIAISPDDPSDDDEDDNEDGGVALPPHFQYEPTHRDDVYTNGGSGGGDNVRDANARHH